MVTPPTLARTCTEVLARNCACLTEFRGAELFAEQLEMILRGTQAHDLRRLARCNGFPTFEPTEENELASGAECAHDSSLVKAYTDMGEARWCGNAHDKVLSASMRYELSVALEHRWKQLYLARLRHDSLNSGLDSEEVDHLNVDLPPGMGSWSAAYAYQERETWRQMRLARARPATTTRTG
ncbi:hypothetical protein F1559_002151 [Cyanidiococcus yangmingshanensis]|uniref:Uncharacterized protein n=1 Tax=Cyanidiococcus yangmingshanensis TaxID=2690220 RepID=A0A7J7IDE8_9RHOD|nr:hypothetical protein F1559_002151 [Cyanidiococcus yangmingshanensis]